MLVKTERAARVTSKVFWPSSISLRAIATPASGRERSEVWSRLLEVAPMYADYARIAPREIPLIVLREVDA
jgi:hypothetical protein